LLIGNGSGFSKSTITAGANVTVTNTSGGITIASTGASGGVPGDGDYGDITVSSSGTVWTIDNDSVTLGKIQNITSDRLLGRDSSGSGDVEQLTVGGGLEFTGSGGIQRGALTGDVTASAGSGTTTIASNSVTYAKIQDVTSTDRILGRSSSGSGDIEEITCTAAGRALIDDVDAASQRTTLGFGSQTGSAPLFGIRAYVQFNGTRNEDDSGASTNNSNVLIKSSGNVSSVKRITEGIFEISFNSEMPSTNYCITGSGVQSNPLNGNVLIVPRWTSTSGPVKKTSSVIQILCYDTDQANQPGINPIDCSVFVII
jgi:hypothetical protein